MSAFPKPEKGTFTAERRRRVQQSSKEELANKAKVRARDVRCRWPSCKCYGLTGILEVAHIMPKSLGGASTTANLILVCSGRHRGTPSLHSQQLSIEPKDAVLGANGPCAFYRRLHDGSWILEGAER
jgi:5-methylcytosine-specific restriction endonuclease McrA